MRFNPNHPPMLGERQHHPIAKMFIQRDKDALLADGPCKNLRVIATVFSHFRRPDHIMTLSAQKVSQLDPQHLAHGSSGRLQHGEFGVQHGGAGVIQGRLNIGAGQLGIAAQERVP